MHLVLEVAVPFGGSPRIHAGEERFSAPIKTLPLCTRFSAGRYSVAAGTIDR